MNALRFCFFYSPLPDLIEGSIKLFFMASSKHFINKRDVCPLWKYESKLVVSSGENVVNTVDRTVNDLNIFHATALV